MKGKSIRWVGGCGLAFAVVTTLSFRPADGEQSVPVVSRANEGAQQESTRGVGPVRSVSHRHSVPFDTTSSAGPDQPSGARPEVARSNDLIAFSSMLATGQQQVVVIDSVERVMSVYRVQPNDGEISLVSVRNIRLDPAIDELNTNDPSPEQIRKMLPK